MEVLEHILCRLPVKTLLQFRSVCKSWYAIITSPTLISIHANWFSNNQFGYLIKHRGPEISSLDKSMFNLIEKLELPHHHLKSFEFNLVGSCNGLLCLTKEFVANNKFPSTYIWNPSIRVCKELPLPPLQIITFIDKNLISYECASGFGFDGQTNDYKVFHIVRAKSNLEDFVIINLVYSSKNQSWRVVEAAHDDYDQFAFPSPYIGCRTSFNGAFHWIPNWDSKSRSIMRFDFCDETIRKTKLPLANKNEIVMCIGSLKNSLVVFVSDALDGKFWTIPCRINTWVMMKKGEMTTTPWIHQFSVPIEAGLAWPLNIGLNGENLFFLKFYMMKNSSWSYRLGIYDNEKKKISEVDTHIRGMFTYSESLFLLGEETKY